MAEVQDLTVGTITKIDNDATIIGNVQANSFNGRTFLTASSALTPSTQGDGIVTENYLYWAMQGRA